MKSAAPYPLSLRQLQYIVAVAEELSFRRAAERCHVSQPALSAQVAELEQALGVQLFERDRRRVLVTEEGRAVLARAEQTLMAAEELVACTEGLRDPYAGVLRIGVIPTVSPYLLPAVSSGLRKTYPRLAFAWVEDKTATLLALLQAGTIDAAVLAMEAPLGDVEHENISKDVFMLAGAKNHPLLAKTTPISALALGEADVLLLDDGHCLRDQALAYCARTRTRELAYRATSLPTLCHMVAGGAGVTLLPKLAVATEASAAGLKVRAFASPVPYRTLALVWRSGAARRAALRAIAATLRASYPKH